MKPHPRIRKAIKWGGAAVTVLLVVVWVGSARWTLVWHDGRRVSWGFSQGQYFTHRGPPWSSAPLPPPFRWYRTPFSLGLDAPSSTEEGHTADGSPVTIRYFAFWPPVVIVGVATIVAWGLDILARRRTHAGFCAKCHYNRTGLAAGVVCPECGAPA